MGDRAQVCIKGRDSKVYLYGHWIGSDIYKATAKALKDVPGRHTDSEYLARAVFCRMVPAKDMLEETGFGIGTKPHGDIEHAIPVLDCDNATVTFEKAPYSSKTPQECTFAEFIERANAGKYDEA